jgi:hypothetical protein
MRAVFEKLLSIGIEVLLLHVFTGSRLDRWIITRMVECACLLLKWNLVSFESGYPFLSSYLLMQKLLKS